MESASYFREKAEQCRRLSLCIGRRDDPTSNSLKALAVEFDAAAAVVDAQTVTAQTVGPVDDLPLDEPARVAH
jgi:hypothetical protein